MTEKISDRLRGLANVQDAFELRMLWNALLVDLARIKVESAAVLADLTATRTRNNNSMISTPGLAIGPSGKETAQAAKPFMAMANGTLVLKPAATVMSVLPASTVTQNKFVMYCWYIDSAGTITTSAATAEAATAAAAFALMPAVPASKAMIGAIIVTDTDSTFVAGTSALDASGVVVIYIDAVTSPAIQAALTATTPTALTLAA